MFLICEVILYKNLKPLAFQSKSNQILELYLLNHFAIFVKKCAQDNWKIVIGPHQNNLEELAHFAHFNAEMDELGGLFTFQCY